MKATSLTKTGRSDRIVQSAVRNYEIYVAHYNSRKLTPMPLAEFLKNYVR